MHWEEIRIPPKNNNGNIKQNFTFFFNHGELVVPRVRLYASRIDTNKHTQSWFFCTKEMNQNEWESIFRRKITEVPWVIIMNSFLSVMNLKESGWFRYVATLTVRMNENKSKFISFVHKIGKYLRFWIRSYLCMQQIWKIHICRKWPSFVVAVGRFTPVHDVNTAIASGQNILDKTVKDLFVTFHCYCKRKDVGFGALLLIPWIIEYSTLLCTTNGLYSWMERKIF